MKEIHKKKKLTANDFAAGNEANYKIPKRILNNIEKKNLEVINAQNQKENARKNSLIQENDDFVCTNDENDISNSEIADSNINDESLIFNDDSNQFYEKAQYKEGTNKDVSNEFSYDSNDLNVLLDLKNVTKKYSRNAKPAIDGISFQVRKGEFHAFVGANGAGKTTTIKSIVGAYAKFDGEIKICGIDNKNKFSRVKLGYIPEIARFPARISSYKYLNSMGMLSGLSKQEADKFANDMLDKFNMTGLKDVSPNNFSSGQKKKILLAQALANNPDILIMDEPAANLDPRSRIEFFDILKELQNQEKSIFISSHILSELDIYANALTILDGGKIVYSGKRKNEKYGNSNYAYKIVLKKDNDFGDAKPNGINLVQDKEMKNHYIISSNNQELINDFISKLFRKQKLIRAEDYTLSIEDMYKKYVIKGSVHTSV